MSEPKFKVDGLDKLIRKLEDIASTRFAIAANRRAYTAGIRPMRSAVKSECPKDEGDLKRSIDAKVSNKGFGVNAIVGSDVSVLEGGKKAEEPNEGPRAARHLHLVINGHITPEGQVIAADDFLDRGYDESIATCLGIVEDKLRESIEKRAEGK